MKFGFHVWSCELALQLGLWAMGNGPGGGQVDEWDRYHQLAGEL